MSMSLIKDLEIRTTGFRGIVRDITERKLAELEKERLRDRLREAEKMEAIGTLAGGVAHDLNNILSGISTYPEFLLEEIPDDSPLRKPMIRIQKSGEKAAAVVQDLLTMARRGVAAIEPTNLNEIIEEYLDSPVYHKAMELHPQIKVKAELDPELFYIMGSRFHLFKTVMNLVFNAIEAISGAGRVRIATANRYLDGPIEGYDTVNEGEYVVLIVEDTGTGISDEDMERIFEPFYTKKKMGRSGTGLGMSVVWGTVKDHNGHININRMKEHGTRVALFFPITRERLKDAVPEIAPEDYMGRGESILIVDDVVEQREIASEILKKLNYSVSSVASGEEAVVLLQNKSFDLLILDMIMDPGMDGLDTYMKILEVHPGQKAIIASGYSESERVRKAQQRGVGRFVRKPYTIENIAAAVREELDKK
jgi:signal transduction histidine kinase/ActR/RegA family two-component response regulator